jgi:glyoxylase-like metal-dependent hydrolase (beta-lactamase superfamily II)
MSTTRYASVAQPRTCRMSMLTAVALAALPMTISSGQSIAPAVPANALPSGTAVTDGYQLEQLGTGLYSVLANGYSSLFMVGRRGVAVVDAPPALGPMLQAAIARTTSKPITHLIYTHHHGDHIGGAGALPAGLTIIAQEEAARRLAQPVKCLDCLPIANPRPRPTITFREQYTLDMGDGQRLELRYTGPNHTAGNSYVYAPAQKVLMAVDVIYPGWAPFDLLANAGDPSGWVRAHAEILAYDFTTIVAGHVTRNGTRADVETQAELIRDVEAAALAHVAKFPIGETIGGIAQRTGSGNLWWLVEQYTDQLVTACAQTVVTKWSGRLGGIEPFAAGHCRRMFYRLRAD